MFYETTVLFGFVADHVISRRAPFILGLLLTFAATLCFALATTLPILLIARLLEGLSTAIVATVGTALMRDVVGQERLGRAMGFSSMALSMGLLLGPVIGGVVYEYCGYFETFLPALVLVGVEVGLRVLIIEDRKGRGSTSKGKGNCDGDESVERTQSSDRRAEYGTNEDTEALLAKPVESGIPSYDEPSNTVVKQQVEESQPLLQQPPSALPLQPRRNAVVVLLNDPRFLTSLLGLFILNSIACGFDAVLGPYISATFGLGPVHVAGLFLSLAIPQLFSPLTGVLTDRYGTKLVAAAGLALILPSLASLAFFSETTEQPMLKLCISFFCIGAAMALVLVALKVDAAAAVEAVEKARPGVFGPRGAQGRGFGLVNGVVAAGGLVGPLAAGWTRISIRWVGLAGVMTGLSLMLLVVVVAYTGERRIGEVEEDKGFSV